MYLVKGEGVVGGERGKGGRELASRTGALSTLENKRTVHVLECYLPKLIMIVFDVIKQGIGGKMKSTECS